MKTAQDPMTRMKKTSVLAMDPGKRDFACCYVVGGKIKKMKMFHHTIYDLKERVYTQLAADFQKEFDKLVRGFGKVDAIVVERFTARPGKSGGAVSESINIMIGFMTAWCLVNNVKIVLVQASTWKNRMKRRLGLDTQAERYGRYVTKTGKLWPIADHEFDAVGIAQWYLETHMGSEGSSKQSDLDLHKLFKSQLDKRWNAFVSELPDNKLRMLNKSIATATKNFEKRQASAKKQKQKAKKAKKPAKSEKRRK